jgi:hypothetical protein
MTALAADKKLNIKAGGTSRYRWGKVATATTIYKGAAVCWNATGYLVPAAATVGLRFAGFAEEQVVNAGADGAKECKFITGVSVAMVNGTATILQAHVGQPAYIQDDQTIGFAPGAAGVVAGYIENLDTDGVWIFASSLAAGAGGVSGEELAVVSNTATAAGVPGVYVFDIPDAATADYDRVLDQAFEVYDVVVVKSGAGAANTVQVKNTATAITNAIAADTDKAVTRAGTVDPASRLVAAAGTLRLTVTRAAGSSLMRVYVLGVKR